MTEAGKNLFPTQRAAGLVFDYARFKEVFLFAQIHDFTHPRKRVFYTGEGFWQAELALAGCDAPQPFACTVRLSRRLYPEAPNHQLGTLARFHQLPSAGRAHRALADAQVTAALLLRMQQALVERWGVTAPDFGFLLALQACPKARLARFLQSNTLDMAG